MRHGFGFLIAVLGLASCSTEYTADVAAEPLLAPLGRLQLAPCEEAPDIECGTLRVPVDYAAPRGDQLRLRVARAKATDERIGVLFVSYGGPGGYQVDSLIFNAASSLARAREHFDLITFDPRGTPFSEPDLHCDFEAPPESATRAAYLDETSRRFAAACLEQTGPVVTKLGANYVARDIDSFRSALGERELSYWGLSYGTAIGAVYASLFPDRARAVVLDANMPNTFTDYGIEMYGENAAATELTLANLDRLCRDDADCKLRDTGLTSGVQQLLAAIRAAPVTLDDGRIIDEPAIARALYIVLISESRSQLLPEMVVNALAGDYSQWQRYIVSDDLGSDQDTQVYSAVLCNDFDFREPATSFLPALEAIEAVYPIGRYSEASGIFRSCQAWPEADPPVLRNIADELATPILLIGNSFDPATPLSWTRHMAHTLGMESSILHYEGGGHTASFRAQPLPCVDDAVMHYLVSRELPHSASCPAVPVDF